MGRGEGSVSWLLDFRASPSAQQDGVWRLFHYIFDSYTDSKKPRDFRQHISLKVAKRVDLKSSHHRKKILTTGGDWYYLNLLWWPFCNIHIYQIITGTPWTKTVSYINYIPIKPGGGSRGKYILLPKWAQISFMKLIWLMVKQLSEIAIYRSYNVVSVVGKGLTNSSNAKFIWSLRLCNSVEHVDTTSGMATVRDVATPRDGRQC